MYIVIVYVFVIFFVDINIGDCMLVYSFFLRGGVWMWCFYGNELDNGGVDD